MTRINFGIPPQDLTDQHLLAEFRELPRIPRKVKSFFLEDKDINVNDGEFTLGSGHVRYFYKKLGYLNQRYTALYTECLLRGFKVKVDVDLFIIKEDDIANDMYLEQYYLNLNGSIDLKYIALIKQRIATRVVESKQTPRYYGKEIDKQFYINQILKLKS